MLYLFDLDGTLISGYMDNPDRAYHTWQLLPGRVARLAQIIAAGHTVGIVSNQGGVAFGMISEADWQQKIAVVCQQLDIAADSVFVCFADARSRDARYNDPRQVARRKPSGAMICEAMAAYGVRAADTHFIGDRPEDAAAAHDAGVRFAWAENFFKGA